MKEKPTLFIDIDGCLATTYQFGVNRKKYHPIHDCYRFDKKCVAVFNEIVDETNAQIVLSSDWKKHYTLASLNEIFEWNGVKEKLIGVTPRFPIEYYTLQLLAEQRALEILDYVSTNKITNFVAIDDLPLSTWIPNNFVMCPKVNEGIKQSGLKDKILKIIS